MQQATISLTTEQMATMAVNLLNTHVLEAGRTEAKQLFRKLEEKQSAPLTNLRAEDGGMIRVDLRLDTRAFLGALNFSAFRDGVLALLQQLSAKIQSETPVSTFRPIFEEGQEPDEDTPERLFAAGGVTVNDDGSNVLMLGITSDPERPILRLQLVYIDPAQFQSESSTS